MAAEFALLVECTGFLFFLFFSFCASPVLFGCRVFFFSLSFIVHVLFFVLFFFFLSFLLSSCLFFSFSCVSLFAFFFFLFFFFIIISIFSFCNGPYCYLNQRSCCCCPQLLLLLPLLLTIIMMIIVMMTINLICKVQFDTKSMILSVVHSHLYINAFCT